MKIDVSTYCICCGFFFYILRALDICYLKFAPAYLSCLIKVKCFLAVIIPVIFIILGKKTTL